jgi:protein transport protein SEC61 subunit alpha
MRVILASNRGTLMELGLSPVVSAGWILQLLIGTGIVALDMSNPREAKLYEGSQKLLAMIIAFG